MGHIKDEFAYWLHNIATEEERALSEVEQEHAFFMWLEARESWDATIEDMEQASLIGSIDRWGKDVTRH